MRCRLILLIIEHPIQQGIRKGGGLHFCDRRGRGEERRGMAYSSSWMDSEKVEYCLTISTFVTGRQFALTLSGMQCIGIWASKDQSEAYCQGFEEWNSTTHKSPKFKLLTNSIHFEEKRYHPHLMRLYTKTKIVTSIENFFWQGIFSSLNQAVITLTSTAPPGGNFVIQVWKRGGCRKGLGLGEHPTWGGRKPPLQLELLVRNYFDVQSRERYWLHPKYW